MNPQVKEAIKAILGSFKEIDLLPEAVKELISNPLAYIDIFKREEDYTDMRAGGKELNSAFGLYFWVYAIFSVISSLIYVLRLFTPSYMAHANDLYGIISTAVEFIATSVSMVIGIVIVFALSSVCVYFSNKSIGAWKTIVAKIVLAIAVLGLFVSLASIVGSILGIIISIIRSSFVYSVFGIVSALLGLIKSCINISIAAMIMNALKRSVGYNA